MQSLHNDEGRADFYYNERFGLIIAFIGLFVPWIIGVIWIIDKSKIFHFIKSLI